MSEDQTEKTYDAKSIKVLEGLEAVRKRPAMYIDSTDIRGLHHLVWEVLDNSVDEALAGRADRIDLCIHEDGSLSVRDNGRGIPVDMHETGVPALEVILTKLHAGGKFDKGSYKVSGGLHGVGISVVNALAEWLEVEISRDGKIYKQRFERGEKASELREDGESDPEKTGTYVRFKPDFEVMDRNEFSYEVLHSRLRELAYLMGTSGLTLTVRDLRTDQSDEFNFPGGIRDYVEHLNRSKTVIHADPIYVTKKYAAPETPDVVYEVEMALQYNDGYNENVFTFVNNITTHEGGTHLIGYRTALTRTLNNYARAQNLLKAKENPPGGEDLREGSTVVLSVKVPEPQFGGQTKGKLGNPEVQGIVETIVGEGLREYFEEQPAAPKAIFSKAMDALRAREAARKARELVRRKSALEGNALPAKLADCHKGTPRDKAELFLVEGDSAGGTAKQGRASYQAILPLRGKILNVEKAPVDSILNHEEIRTIVTALGTGFFTDEFEPDKLRYGKIIIMTDADVDGSHIRTLLLTLFYRKLPELVERGYVYVAQPPLYLIKKGKKQQYAVDDADKTRIVLKLGIGATKLTLPTTKGEPRMFEGEDLRSLMDVLTAIQQHERRLPIEAEIPFGDYLAEVTVPELELPHYWLVHEGEGRFLDTEAQLEAELEKLRVDGTLKIYSGHGSNCTRDNADVEVHTLHVGTDLAVQLQKLLDLDLHPELFAASDEREIVVDTGKDNVSCRSLREAFRKVEDLCQNDLDIQRYKGLGEMNGSQLYESTMDPERRTLYRVSIHDSAKTDEIFNVLMGPNVEPRREFIEKHALEATNLDV